MLPRIGITTSFNEDEQRLRRDYVRAIEAAGGLPFVAPMLEKEVNTRAFAALLDGLVVTGGPAITEGLIGTLPDDLDPTDAVRSHTDRLLLEAVLSAGKPVLGICYGMQLLNAHFGGTIYADIEGQQPNILVHSEKRGGTAHAVRLTPGTHLHALMGREELTVNTRHVQAVATPGAGLHVSATAPDGVIEALENEAGTILGVQFHPERLGATWQPLFHHLVARATDPDVSRPIPA